MNTASGPSPPLGGSPAKTSSRSAAKAVQACLSRIAACESELHAWQYVDAEAVQLAAGACDELPESQRGPLHGLLVGVKDIFDTHDMPTAYGSAAYEGHRPAADAAAVALLRANGAIMVGKTVTTEFAGWTPAQTRNPHDLTRTPGGSSSGSAAAVAVGMVPVALGTQTLGSVIRPASFCGIVGFKPSYGRISRVGVKPLAESLDTVGIMARSIAEVASVYRVLSGTDAVHLDASPGKLAFCRGPYWQRADEDARLTIELQVAALRDAGLQVDEIEMPSQFALLAEAAKLIQDFELWRGFAHERAHLQARISQSFRTGMQAAGGLTADKYERALRLGDEARAQLPVVTEGYDAVLSLSAPGEAPVGLGSTGDPIMNSWWTLLYAPCVTVPVLRGRSGLPIGLQVSAPRYHDSKVLQVAHWLHEFCIQRGSARALAG
jgi:Asp-tRNA(Asn)/Glu-tRNA(Gln) amidotransferase A subunit family amidase